MVSSWGNVIGDSESARWAFLTRSGDRPRGPPIRKVISDLPSAASVARYSANCREVNDLPHTSRAITVFEEEMTLSILPASFLCMLLITAFLCRDSCLRAHNSSEA